MKYWLAQSSKCARTVPVPPLDESNGNFPYAAPGHSEAHDPFRLRSNISRRALYTPRKHLVFLVV
jgi:hypothetical protein